MHVRNILLVFLAVGLLAVSPPASADEVGLAFFAAPLDALLAPGGDAASTHAVGSFRCEAFGERDSAMVTFTVVEAPAWATVRFAQGQSQTMAVSQADCSGSRVIVEAPVSIRASRDAPALRAEDVTLQLDLDMTNHSLFAISTLPVQAAWRGELELHPQTDPVVVRSGDVVTLTFDVVNLGNGLARVTFEVDELSGWSIPLPGSIVLGAPADGEEGARSTVTLSAIAPSTRSDLQPGDIVLHATPVHPVDTSLRGETETASVAVERGSAMPMGGVWLVVVACMCALVMLRRR